MEMSPEILRHYAALLDYPRGETADELAGLMPLMRADCPSAADRLSTFHRFVADADSARMEEAYTATFDLRPLCSPYVGYHVCGEGYQRSRFLVKLQEIYRRHDFTVKGELADHFAAVAHFLSLAGADPEAQDLVLDGLLPALEKSLTAFDEPTPYGELIRSLQIWLKQSTERLAVDSEPREESVQ